MANGGLVTDPELFPSWANDGDNIYQWTDSKNAVILVPTTIYNLLTQPWRGQANCNRNVKNEAAISKKRCFVASAHFPCRPQMGVGSDVIFTLKIF